MTRRLRGTAALPTPGRSALALRFFSSAPCSPGRSRNAASRLVQRRRRRQRVRHPRLGALRGRTASPSRAATHWLRLGAALRATDDPDTRLHDTYHHVYDVWGTTYGDAPDRVQDALRHGRCASSAPTGPGPRAAPSACSPTTTPTSATRPTPTAARREERDARAPRVGDEHAHEREGRAPTPGCVSTASRSAAAPTAPRSVPRRTPTSTTGTLVRTYSAKGWVPSTATITRQLPEPRRERPRRPARQRAKGGAVRRGPA